MATSSEPQAGRSGDRSELLVTLLLVVAALATSWSSYQAARWHGEQATTANRTSAIRIEAARAADRSNQLSGIDVATFIAWADADRSAQTALADFYEARFRPEFTTAFDAWVATRPLTDPRAPRTPFAMPEYQLASTRQAQELDVEAEDSATEVGRNIQHASNYVLTVVLYSVVLFFAGMSTKLNGRRARRVMVLLGTLVLIATIGWTITFPVSLAI